MKAFSAVVRMVTVGVLMAIAGSVVAQQAYPNKPIRFIVPYVTGGTATILAQLVGQKLTESWRQQMIVDNRPGGNTIIAAEALAKSSPDGYTIMMVSSAHTIVPRLYDKLPYDVINDFAPVATLVQNEQLLVLHPSVPANNLHGFIALAKSKPGQLNYASPGSGTVAHLAGELFNMMTGVNMQHIPYKGAAPAMTDLMGGQVQLGFVNPAQIVPHIKSGKLKGIAITGETRSSALPQVPTFTEAGLPGLHLRNWYGVVAPIGTSQGIIDKLSTEIAKILPLYDVTVQLASQGLEAFISTPEHFAALIKADSAMYGKVIKTANIKIED